MKTKETWLRWLLDRAEGACVIETDASGLITQFGPGAEAFFVCPAAQAIGQMKYSEFHDAAELEACKGSPEFVAALAIPGWTEDVWRVVPLADEPFAARVTLIPLRDFGPAEAPGAKDKITGWLAHYRRLAE